MGRRACARHPAVAAWLVWTAGCAGQPSHVALAPPAQPGPISGTVLDSGGRPGLDQIVAIGAEKTTSDGDGRFSFPMVPAGYDLVIASPDASAATVYQGLTHPLTERCSSRDAP